MTPWRWYRDAAGSGAAPGPRRVRPDVKIALAQVALTATLDTGRNFEAKMRAESAAWAKLLKGLNIQAD